MKIPAWLFAGLLVGGTAMAAPEPDSDASLADSAGVPPAATEAPGRFWSFSYTIGYTLGGRLHGDIPELDLDAVLLGVREAVSGLPGQLDEAAMRTAMQEYADYRQQQAREAQEALARTNLEKANAFLAQNGKRKGVKTTKSGLQYEVLTKARGAVPQPTDHVTAHYHGTLIDGTVFDSSLESEPVDFPLDRVIPGWTEGLQLMAKGAKFRFWVPPALAYGARGIDEVIGPNQVLVFEVQLLDFKPAPVSESEAPAPTHDHAH